MTVDDSKLEHWAQSQEARKHLTEPEQRELPLKGGSGGGTSDGMVPIKDYVDSRDDAVESRLTQKLDKLSTKGTIWAAMATAVALIAAMLTFGGDRFDSGLSVGPAFEEAAIKQGTTDSRQNENIAKLNEKLDILIVRTTPEHANQTSEKLRGN